MINFFLKRKKILFFLIVFFFLFKKHEKKILKIFDPLFFLSYAARSFLKAITFYSNDKGDLYKKYDDLEKKYDSLRHKYQSVEYIKDYILSQKKNISPFIKYSKPFIPAKILLLKTSHDEQIFFINCGEKDGICKGDTVIYGNDLLGIIQKTYFNYSEVCMTTDARSKIALKLLKNNIKGITQGCNKRDLIQALYVEDDSEIKVDDPVYTSGEGLVYPEGFLIGKIKEIIRGNGLYITLLIEPNFKIENLFNCLVLLNENKLNLKNNYEFLDNFLFEEIEKNQIAKLDLKKKNQNSKILEKANPEKQKIENLPNQKPKIENDLVLNPDTSPEKPKNLNIEKKIENVEENIFLEEAYLENKKNEEIQPENLSQIFESNPLRLDSDLTKKEKKNQIKNRMKKFLNFSKTQENLDDPENKKNYSEENL